MHAVRFLAAAALVAIAGAVVGLVPAHAATTQYVVTTTDDVVAADAATSLREALTAAAGSSEDTEIVLQAGATYHLTICGAGSEDANASGDLDANTTGPLLLTGNGATVVQDCAGERVLHNHKDLTLSAVTITGGSNTANISNQGLGGGILTNRPVTIIDSTISGNDAYDGGAVFGTHQITVTRSVISGNTALHTVGGLYGNSSVQGVDLTDSTITGNQSSSLSAVYSGDDLVVRNSTITGNVNTGNLPTNGLVGAAQDVELVHATIAGNTLPAGILVYGTTVTAEASILHGTTSTTCNPSGTTTSLGGNIDSGTSCELAGPTDQQSVADLGLSPLGDYGGPTPTMRPLPGSPALNTVPRASCSTELTVDQRGVARPQGTRCDSGATELRAQADGEVRRDTRPFVGNDIYNTTAAGQTRTSVIDRNGTARFTVRSGNDGEVADTLVIRGPAGHGNVTVRYFVGNQDVTASVVAGRPVVRQPGATGSIGIRVHAGPLTAHGAIRNLLIRVRSTNGGAADCVEATVRVR